MYFLANLARSGAKLLNFQSKSRNCPIAKREFWAWINIIFNKVDEQRLKVVGPDRLCAEWLLKNGASAKFLATGDVLQTDYNALPDEDVQIKLVEIDASHSAILNLGLDHLRNCKHVHSVIIHDCDYVGDEGLDKLQHINATLENLQISRCKNVTDDGLHQLKVLTNLKNLVTFELQFVKNIKDVEQKLKSHMPHCKFDMQN